MIRYTLKCDQNHSFDSWFASAEAYEKLRAAGMVACAVCGSKQIDKALMAPAVRPARKAPVAQPAEAGEPQPVSQGAMEEALAAIRRAVEENSDYVGVNFVSEARAMHAGEKPERAIHGEAKPDEARALIDEGIPVTPLPFVPKRSTN